MARTTKDFSIFGFSILGVVCRHRANPMGFMRKNEKGAAGSQADSLDVPPRSAPGRGLSLRVQGQITAHRAWTADAAAGARHGRLFPRAAQLVAAGYPVRIAKVVAVGIHSGREAW